MLRARIMPCLLLQNGSLVKTVRFREPAYIGDPINAIRIYNEKEVDELVLLDITATVEARRPPLDLLRDIASECFMPMAYGGGVRQIDDMHELFRLGIEKVVINSVAAENPQFVRLAAESFGSQSVVVSIDARRKRQGRYEVMARGGRERVGKEPGEYAAEMERLGAGEIFLASIDRDGTYEGYDIDLIKEVTRSVSLPVIACGGAGSLQDLAVAVTLGGAAACALGSMAVYFGRNRAVLVNFPARDEIEAVLQ